jgi:DnaJ homolog subfamily C member 28
MDFIDYRKSSKKITIGSDEAKQQAAARYRSKRYRDYVEELIQSAQQRGEFDNLEGMGRPLNLDASNSAGDKSLAYSLLKSNGYAPVEVELANEIRRELERAEGRLVKVIHRGSVLRARRVQPFPSEKRAYNAAVETAVGEYDKALRDLNRKIMTLNLIAPPPLHRPLLDIAALVQDFRASCPTFTL